MRNERKREARGSDDRVYRSLRSAILAGCALGIFVFAELSADENPAPAPAPAKAPEPEAAAKPADDPSKAPPSPSSNRIFKPTQEISPDQEIDFPADL